MGAFLFLYVFAVAVSTTICHKVDVNYSVECSGGLLYNLKKAQRICAKKSDLYEACCYNNYIFGCYSYCHYIIGVWYYKTKFFVPDKDNMTCSLADSITSCYYECGGGMNGEYTEYKIYDEIVTVIQRYK